MVDHTRKGLLGRMVCAFGPLNQALVPVSFPSADPEAAFQACAGKQYDATCDCMWGFTQLLLDEETSRKLVICTRSGLYRWLRLPFGPMPGPAIFQSYVHSKFYHLQDREGERFVCALMDDIKISSRTRERSSKSLRI